MVLFNDGPRGRGRTGVNKTGIVTYILCNAGVLMTGRVFTHDRVFAFFSAAQSSISMAGDSIPSKRRRTTYSLHSLNLHSNHLVLFYVYPNIIQNVMLSDGCPYNQCMFCHVWSRPEITVPVGLGVKH